MMFDEVQFYVIYSLVVGLIDCQVCQIIIGVENRRGGDFLIDLFYKWILVELGVVMKQFKIIYKFENKISLFDFVYFM